jgi:hypothetical protein
MNRSRCQRELSAKTTASSNCMYVQFQFARCYTFPRMPLDPDPTRLVIRTDGFIYTGISSTALYITFFHMLGGIVTKIQYIAKHHATVHGSRKAVRVLLPFRTVYGRLQKACGEKSVTENFHAHRSSSSRSEDASHGSSSIGSGSGCTPSTWRARWSAMER